MTSGRCDWHDDPSHDLRKCHRCRAAIADEAAELSSEYEIPESRGFGCWLVAFVLLVGVAVAISLIG